MDTNLLSEVVHLSDGALLVRTKYLVAREREATALLIAHLAELDERKLYLGEGCSSLFSYCTQVLHLSEYGAYNRIQAARAARRFPLLLEQMVEGAVTLTTVGLLAPHLTEANHREVLEAARHKSKRQVEELVVRLHPRPLVPSTVRRLPEPQPVTTPTFEPSEASPDIATRVVDGSPPPSFDPGIAGADTLSKLMRASAGPTVVSYPALPATIEPLAPERYKVQVTVDKEAYDNLRFAQALLRHQIPDGDVAAIFTRALRALLDDLMKQKLSATERPRANSSSNPHSRHIPAEVKRAVWARDGGRCAFVGRSGRRCAEEGFLEFHHVESYAAGGEATVENIELRCRAHNAYEAVQLFGQHSAQAVRETRELPPSAFG